MGWSDGEDENILFDLEAIDASTSRRGRRADDEEDKSDTYTVTDKLVDDEAEADADDVDADSPADDDRDERKAGVSVEEKEETRKKAPTALLYMVHKMSAEVGHETGMKFSNQVTLTQHTSGLSSARIPCRLLMLTAAISGVLAVQMLSLVRDVVLDHVHSVGRDAELFAKHAKRSVGQV